MAIALRPFQTSHIAPRPLRPEHERSRQGIPARRFAQIAAVTGPLEEFAGSRLVVLGDTENLTYSARDLGYKVSYRSLAALLLGITHSCSLYAFFSREPHEDRRVEYFVQRGWTPYPNDIHVVDTCKGRQRRANCDNFLLFHAGRLVSRSNADVVCIASGDGALAGDLARAMRTLPKPRKIVTLSIAGSTSYHLNAAENPFIDANLELGLDCLIPADPGFRPSREPNATYPQIRKENCHV